MYYDLTGSITYALLAVGTLSITAGRTRSVHARQLVATAFVLVWIGACVAVISFMLYDVFLSELRKEQRFGIRLTLAYMGTSTSC